MGIIIWTLLLILFAFVCIGIGFTLREFFFTRRGADATALITVNQTSENVEDPAPQADRTETFLHEDNVVELPAAKQASGDNDDDLQIVEGVGPKIESVLKMNGVQTRTQLARTSIDELRRILTVAGPSYQMYDPSTWSYQARLAVEGRWEELNEYQDFLGGGREA